MASAQAAVSPVAQPSRPKSVSRPKRWSEEVEEGNIHVYIFKFECCRFDTRCNKYLSLFFFSPAYRFQIAGYRDVHEYRDVKQKEPVSDYKYIFPYH